MKGIKTMTTTGSKQVDKKTWYAYGGFSNPKCWRKMVGSSYKYYIRFD